nr:MULTISPECIES: hypothetical protein [unclassified Methylobacterium]
MTFAAERPDGFGTGGTEVPVLIDGDLRIFVSTVILEDIGEGWPEPPRLPRDPTARLRPRDGGCPQYAGRGREWGLR